MPKNKHILNNVVVMDSLIALISVLGGGDLIVILAVRNYSFINDLKKTPKTKGYMYLLSVMIHYAGVHHFG